MIFDMEQVRILALETATQPGSIALAVDGQIMHHADFPTAARTTESFAEVMQDTLRQAGWTPRSVGLIGVSGGPGSFTGLRIGITAAKVFAYATGCAVVKVPTMHVIAAAAPPLAERLWVISSAQQRGLYVARFRQPAESHADGLEEEESPPASVIPWQQVGPVRVMTRSEWLERLTPGDLLTGPAVARLADDLPAEVAAVEPERRAPTAANVARLARARFLSGIVDDLWKLVPDYCRPSAAEEKRTK